MKKSLAFHKSHSAAFAQVKVLPTVIHTEYVESPLAAFRHDVSPDAYEQFAAARLIDAMHQAVDSVPSYAERYQREHDEERTAYLNYELSLGI